ncbi:enoyl-CoA hydratase/isomerase family protein [Leptospira sp. GIMC2001]|uniref:enoyl-CoA hydratase/isomerase family protein n=1 Tax=Leptospira sp. GIMC2001 TaxID=1513297 RepID=UPI00234AFF6D|nr:enoyl-CoA hydratase/isomerase family protein [Leptospira sp. GIMC2001]WCL49469.1 enoyl-CoA hydratase/isomerase family protein [Leptospira sp. GIMC2001]
MFYNREVVELGGKKAEIITIQTNDQNSLTGANMKALTKILHEIQADPNIRGIVLASDNEKFFCNGLDAENLLSTPRDRLIEEVGGIVLLFGELIKFSKPIIAEVSGYAMGGGAVITVASDFKYMLDSKARIAFTEILVGLPLPGSFIDRIKGCVTPKYWGEVCLTGANYKANEAKEIGLIDDVAPNRAELRKMTLKKLEYLIKLPTSAYQSTKKVLNRELLSKLAVYEKETMDSFAIPGVIENLLEAMSALKEKRRPNLD